MPTAVTKPAACRTHLAVTRVTIALKTILELNTQFGEPLFRRSQCFFFFAKGEAHLRRAVLWVIVKTRTWNASHADFLYKIFCEGDIPGARREPRVVCGKIESRDVGHDVVGTARLVSGEPGVLQNFQQAFAFFRISSREIFVVRIG